MLPPVFTISLLLLVAFAIISIATLAYVSNRAPDTRFALVVSLLLVFAGVSLAPLFFFRSLLLG
jgi:hypothetical protein